MQPHPEGGFYVETFRDTAQVGGRPAAPRRATAAGCRRCRRCCRSHGCPRSEAGRKAGHTDTACDLLLCSGLHMPCTLIVALLPAGGRRARRLHSHSVPAARGRQEQAAPAGRLRVLALVPGCALACARARQLGTGRARAHPRACGRPAAAPVPRPEAATAAPRTSLPPTCLLPSPPAPARRPHPNRGAGSRQRRCTRHHARPRSRVGAAPAARGAAERVVWRGAGARHRLGAGGLHGRAG